MVATSKCFQATFLAHLGGIQLHFVKDLHGILILLLR